MSGLQRDVPSGESKVAEYVRMSTDHQRYSVENQSALIRAFAAREHMTVIETYADLGRSGLTLRERPGLSRLLADVVAGNVPFSAVLVYDVSRWGRFQDVDESAHYEFLCRRGGVKVIYCAEQFAADATPFASVLKSLKRAMAGEFSRELSVKTAAGKARIAGKGFRVGGIAGFGLRRQVMEDGVRSGRVLDTHQWKSIQTDRVILVPGPPEEVYLVRRMYRDFIHRRRSPQQIADELNSEGHAFEGRPWSRNLVNTILSNEKYIGNSVAGKFSQRLKAPQTINPEHKWIRCRGAYESIIDECTFNAAAEVRRWNRKTFISEEAILDALRSLLAREGKLSTALIDRASGLPSAVTVINRFGSLGRAYERLGYKLPVRYEHHAIDRDLSIIIRDLREQLVGALTAMDTSYRLEESGAVLLCNGLSVALVRSRYQRRRDGNGWRIAFQRTPDAGVFVAVRFHADGRSIRDLLVIPREVLSSLPSFLNESEDCIVTQYMHRDIPAVARAIAQFGGLNLD